MNKIKEAISTNNPDTYGEGISEFEKQRVSSISAVVGYLAENGLIKIQPNLKVLDIGAGSGAGVFAWRAFGVKDENIAAVDWNIPANKLLIGNANFRNAEAKKYMRSLSEGQFDIISAFRIPYFSLVQTPGADAWYQEIARLLGSKENIYLETYSEWPRNDSRDEQNRSESRTKKTSISFMGDILNIPKLPLLNSLGVKGDVMMGHPSGTHTIGAETIIDYWYGYTDNVAKLHSGVRI